MEQKAAVGLVGHLCLLLRGHHGGEVRVLARLCFEALGLERWSVWTLPPRTCVLGGAVQTCTLAAWVADGAYRGRMELRGSAHERCWSWADGQAGFP